MRNAPSVVRLQLLPVLAALATMTACDNSTTPATAPQLDASAAVVAAAKPAASGTQLVPFMNRATFQPTGGSIACGVYGTFPVTWVGTGITSHLGLTTTVATWQTCTVVGGYPVVTGEATSTGANGDAITFAFTQTFTAFTATSSSFDFGPMTIISGTGRFAGASGSATGGGTFDRVAGRGVWEVNGTMTPPGVAKRSGQ